MPTGGRTPADRHGHLFAVRLLESTPFRSPSGPSVRSWGRLVHDVTDLSRSVQRALLGEVPPTLRFVYAELRDDTLHFRAVFTDDAPDEHLECARVACTEVLADCPSDTKLDEVVERDERAPWRVGGGENLWFLRHGELDDA